MEQTNDKRPWYKAKWVWIVGILIIFYIGGLAGTGTGTSSQNNQSDERVQESSSGQYVEVFTFSGSGQKKSEPFTITGSRFKIVYDCVGQAGASLCQAFLFKVGSTLPQPFLNTIQSIKDETIIYTSVSGKGEYYIDANVIGNFTMTVYDYR